MCTYNKENDVQMNALHALYRGLLQIRVAQNIEEARELADALHNLPIYLSKLRSNSNESPDTERDLEMILSTWQKTSSSSIQKKPVKDKCP